MCDILFAKGDVKYNSFGYLVKGYIFILFSCKYKGMFRLLLYFCLVL
jgi:hypothetical protein